jgi:serine/threonine-protein kinase
VYRARDVVLDEIVALKVLRREMLRSASVVERFRSEVKLARRVTHRNVARMFDIGEHEGERFLTMEFVDGEMLATMIAAGARGRGRPVPLKQLGEIAEQICAGLAAAHAVGVIHRDLKPDNVMVGRDGRVAITDFGIARALQPSEKSTAAEEFIGTPEYMSPEQAEGSVIDLRTDVWRRLEQTRRRGDERRRAGERHRAGEHLEQHHA